MITIHKKVVVDEHGKPTEVIIPWEEYKEMEELLGLDLDKEAVSDLKQAQDDRASGNKEAYSDLDSI
jgi:PHD/YefM family antitoxin component YafN of YafNO toxin-antitoxin module